MGKCFLCPSLGVDVCSDCPESVGFCSDAHLRVHRGGRNGDSSCLPFRIEKTEEKGNVMVATREIKASEVILVDTPAVSGPKHKSRPVCLECTKPCIGINPDSGEIEGEFCEKCGFPVCNQKCESKTIVGNWECTGRF